MNQENTAVLPWVASRARKNSNYGGYQAFVQASVDGKPGLRETVAKALGETSRQANERATMIEQAVNARADMLGALKILTTLVYEWRKTGKQPDLHELSIACDSARSIIAKEEGTTP